MINPDKVGVGDFVEVIEVFKDYGKVGDTYRLLDSRVPKEPTTAIGWKVDLATGKVDLQQAFKLPHDKIEVVSRKKIAKALEGLLSGAEANKRMADRAYNVIKGRIDGLLNHDSKEEEARSLMSKTFYWM